MKDDVFSRATEIKEEIERIEKDLHTLKWYKRDKYDAKRLCREVTTTTRGFIREHTCINTYDDMDLTQEDIEILNHIRQYKKAKLEEEFKHLGDSAQQGEPDIIPCPFCGSTDVKVDSYPENGKDKPVTWRPRHKCKCAPFKKDDEDTWADDDAGFYFSSMKSFNSRESAIEFWNRQCQLAKENLANR